MSSSSSSDISLNTLEAVIKEEQRKLDEDKKKLQRNLEGIKKGRSAYDDEKTFHNVSLPVGKYDLQPNNVEVHDQVKEKCASKDRNKIFMIRNPREEEINKFRDKISKPNDQQCFTTNKNLRKSFPQSRRDFNQYQTPVNIRERKIEQLSEKLASSECPLTKPSCRQIAKNLNSSITFNDVKQNNVIKANDRNKKTIDVEQYFIEDEKSINEIEREEYLRVKYNHPRIVVSDFQENNKNKVGGDFQDNKMVKIGEFSPLNPNLPGGATVLGLGEWDEKRQLLLQKYRQTSRSPSPSPTENDQSKRSIATQTDLGDDWSANVPGSIYLEKQSQHSCQTPEKNLQTFCELRYESEEKRCNSSVSLSPVPKCFENMTEKEVKEFIYRQELKKQIEEKNRLKEEIRRKEAEEEAKIEAKIQRDLEKIRRQFEEERLQRLELAIRKREQEDFLRQRLVVEQQKGIKESKFSKKRSVPGQGLPKYSHKQHEKSTQSDFDRPSRGNVTQFPYSQLLPERSTASVMSSVHEDLRQPLLQPSTNLMSDEGSESHISDKNPERSTIPPSHKPTNSTAKESLSPPISALRSKEVDILAQKAVFVDNTKTSPQMNDISSFPSDAIKDRLKEVDNLLRQPLLPESQFLPPVSQPLLYATIPPLSASLQNPRGTALPAPNRTNFGILEDKWKVPNTEQETETRANTKHNPRILTQLGTFRRQLQEESLRMRQRVREDSP